MVIAIIGVLSSIVFVSVGAARSKARDAVRKSDLKQIAIALEMFYDKNGSYPRTAGWCTQISNPTSNWGPDFQSDIAEWLPNVPLDPKFAGTYQDYFYRNIDDHSYSLYAELEGEDVANDGLSGCARIGGINNEYDYRYPNSF